MARNEEKAMAMLNRWVKMKRSINTKQREKRPKTTSDVTTIQEGEHWRSQIIREMVKKVSDIQNASLGEHRIRDLNDEINELLKEKAKWEDHIRDLGGPDYKLAAALLAKTSSALDGDELPGADGYKYFGAAKNLPKVRELFQKEAPQPPKASRADLYKRVSYRYLGYEPSPSLESREKEIEAFLRKNAHADAVKKR
jgi:pre-mRNA-splicing factor ISY1